MKIKLITAIILSFFIREINAQIAPTPLFDTTYVIVDSINANKFVTHSKRELSGSTKDGSNSAIFLETIVENVYDKNNFKLYEKTTSQKRDRCIMTPVKEVITKYELDGSYKQLTKSKSKKIVVKKYNSKNKLLSKSQVDMTEYYKWGSYIYNGKTAKVK